MIYWLYILVYYRQIYFSSASTGRTSSKAMRSRASEKFTRLHPDSHSGFRAMMASARMTEDLQEDQLDSEDLEEAKTPEITNMLKNKILTQFREGDDDIEEILRRNRKMITKKLTWSQNLIQVQILFDWHYSLSIENFTG